MLRLATGGIYSDDLRFPQNSGIVGICYHETALFGQNFDRKSVGNCKIHLISEWQIVSPLIIGAEIGDGGFDLNNNIKTLLLFRPITSTRRLEVSLNSVSGLYPSDHRYRQTPRVMSSAPNWPTIGNSLSNKNLFLLCFIGTTYSQNAAICNNFSRVLAQALLVLVSLARIP